jgi:general secretion pathway protein D
MKTITRIQVAATILLTAGTVIAQNQPAPAPAANPATPPPRKIQLNFKDTPLAAVMEYLSKEAGFVVVMDTKIEGSIDAISAQPVTVDEAFDVINSILATKGYTAIRNGRVLTVVDVRDAKTRMIPVKQGSDPEKIPPNEEVVTQIMPIRYANAQQLIANLQPLMDENTSITANESSNALLLTGSQSTIHRMAQIIKALDTSISGITAMRVYPLRNAAATDVANIINQVMGNQGANSGRGSNSSSRSSGGPSPTDIMSRIRSRMGGGR